MTHRLIIFCAIGAVFLAYGCEQKPNGKQILRHAIEKHDPQGKWNKTRLEVHIREPRKGNPHRYSQVTLDNHENTFELSRNRDDHVSTHLIDADGNSEIRLDGSADIDSALVSKYRLDARDNQLYKAYYEMMFGLPMSLDSSTVKEIHSTSKTMFRDEPCFLIELELKREMIASHWNLYISRADTMLEALELVHPTEPDRGERIVFHDIYNTDGIRIPRIRNWFDLRDNSYLGTDVIVDTESE